MELITMGIGLIVSTCAKNKELHNAVDDFVSDSVKWIRGWFGKGENKALMQKLEAEPQAAEVQKELSKAMGSMAGNEQFMKQLEKWIEESKKPNPSMKNVLKDIDVEAGGNIQIGDKTASDQKFDMKNVVERGKFKAGGDFTLGDG
jgi:hypothetical protein